MRPPLANNSHLADKPILVDWLSLLSICEPRGFCPHFLHILENHVAMPVECLDSGKEFPSAADRHKYLIMASYGGLKD